MILYFKGNGIKWKYTTMHILLVELGNLQLKVVQITNTSTNLFSSSYEFSLNHAYDGWLRF